MAEFDIQGARQSGVPDSEIAAALAPKLNYDLDGARKAGVSDTEITDTLVAKFNSTPGGAATGLLNKPTRSTPAGNPLYPIGAAGAGAGAMGVVLPELLTGAAGLARQIPQGARVAPWLESAAIAAKSTGRVKTGTAGAVSGLAAETAGQAMEAGGAPQWAAEGTRFIVGGLTPETHLLAKQALELWKKKLPTTIEEAGIKRAARLLAAKLEGRPQDIDAEEAALLNKMVGELRGGAPSEAPSRGVYDILQTGARSRLATGEQEARTIIGNSNLAIQKELDAAAKNRDYATTASERIAKRGEDALAAAQLQRLNVGEDVTHSDIGTGLRGVVVKRNEAALAARAQRDAQLREARDTLVSGKEASGVQVDAMPEYQALVSSLKSEIQPGKHSAEVADNFRHILKQITTKAKEADLPFFGGMGSDVFAQIEKPPVKPPVSFQMLDDARRGLGKVFEKNPPEGYAAIDAATARKYYGQIAALQKKFAGGEGGAHDLLQKNYADSTEGLQMFGSKGGKRLSAVDRFDESKFQTDAAALPNQFFKTKQGVNDLLELTGDKNIVVKSARDFATKELEGMNTTQAREWMNGKGREMLAELPEVRGSVLKYLSHLQYGEQVSRNAAQGVKRLDYLASERTRAAEAGGRTIGSEAATRAGQITTQRGQEAVSLIGPKGEMFPVQNVKDLIEKGNTKQWTLAAPHILASPNGKTMLADSIRQTMADRAMKSTKDLSGFFDNNVRPALVATRLMPQSQIENISSQLKLIENMKLPEQQILGWQRRLIFQSFGGLAASAAVRGGSSLADLIPQP